MAKPPNGSVKIHVGCGMRFFGNDWLHVDADKSIPGLDGHDAWVLPTAWASASMIYASHFLEYFNRDEVVGLLSRWRAYLCDGGTVRVSVPNFGKLAELYIEGGVALRRIIGPLYGRRPCNGGTIYHRMAYNRSMLMGVFEDAGFPRAGIAFHDNGFQDKPFCEFDDQSKAAIDGQLISLCLEARR